MTYKNAFISLAILAMIIFAIGMTFFIYRSQVAVVTMNTAVPDAIMEEVHAIFMDKQGKPAMKIVSDKMVHYGENDTTLITQPQLTLYRKSPNPWLITANFARTTQGIDQVYFWDDVNIRHAADAASPNTLIKTPTLTVHTHEQTAETADLITLIQPSMVVKATGMIANMDAGDIKLLSHAWGEYAPQS